MRPRIHVLTLAVADLDRAPRFYRDGLGFASPGIIGAEHIGDERNAAGATAMFQLEGGLILALYPRTELAKDANIAPRPAGSGDFSIGHLVGTREAVDEVLAAAARAGAALTEAAHARPWGIYSGYFRDLDGHLWEVIWGPELEVI